MIRRPMSLSEVEVLLQTYGYFLQRTKGRHRIYRNNTTGHTLPLAFKSKLGAQVPGVIIENTLKEIQRATQTLEERKERAEIQPVSVEPKLSRPRQHIASVPRRDRPVPIAPTVPSGPAINAKWLLELPAILQVTIVPRQRSSSCTLCGAQEGPFYTFTGFLPRNVRADLASPDQLLATRRFMEWYQRQKTLTPQPMVVAVGCEHCIRQRILAALEDKSVANQTRLMEAFGKDMLAIWWLPSTGGLREELMGGKVSPLHLLPARIKYLAETSPQYAPFVHYYPHDAEDLRAYMADSTRIPF